MAHGVLQKMSWMALLPLLLVTADFDSMTAEEECEVNQSECALHMIQRHGMKVRGNTSVIVGGSCQQYGCVGYESSHQCQCNAECHAHGNCCSDYTSTCKGKADSSCHAYGCGKYAKSQRCQCNDKCAQYRDCCSDYTSICSAAPGSCSAYGCGKYVKTQKCQCNHKCAEHGNCCADYASTCSAASCSAYGCGKYVKSQQCQCNAECVKFGNCCPDYASTCTPANSCRAHGCGKFDKSRQCQCNELCTKYKNCCADYHSTCAAPSTSDSCRAFGCGEYVKSQPCQCNAHCVKYGNCCSDYQATCTAHTPGQVHGHPSTSKTYPTYKGFTLALVEEFDSPMDLDSDPIWTWSDGGLIEGQIRYARKGIKFEDGKMKIEVSRGHSPDIQSCSHAEVTRIPHKSLSSGEMRTRHNMFRYGRYEASIKAPEVQPGNGVINGNYVSTMFVFRAAKYKHWREIDVEITGNSVDSLHTNVLSADDTAEWNESMGEEMDHKMGTNLRTHFHTYAIEWLPHRVTWYFDGKVVREKKGGTIPIPSLSAKIMMNMWVFDDRALFGGKEIKNDRFPMHTEYDWFRFYKWDGDKQYPCAGMGTQCLTKDDKYLSSNNPCDGIAQEGTVYGKAPCLAHCH